MPRYYLNLRYGPGPGMLSVDPEGDDIADESLLRAHVLASIRKVMRTRLHFVRDWMTCSFEILDSDRALVFVVPFSEVVPGEDDAV